MPATDYLRVYADWGRDATFTHPLADITGRVLSCAWKWGFDAPGQLVSPAAQGTVVLDNSDGAFWPGAGGAYADILQRDVLIKFEHTNSKRADTWPLLILRVVDVQFTPGRFNERTVTLTLTDWYDELSAAVYDAPLTASQYTGNATYAPFDDGLLPYPYAGMWAVLDGSRLDVDARLFDPTGLFSVAQGETLLDYVGNNLDAGGRGTSLLAFIQEMCQAEMDGRFRFQVNTVAHLPLYVFYGRLSLAEQYPDLTVYDVPASALMDAGNDYEYGRELCNAIDVTYYPRTVGAAGTVIASTTSPMAIPGLGSRELTLRYRDPDYPDGTCAATTLIPPVANTDYTGNLSSDGTGEDYTGNLVVTVENRTNAAHVTVTNTATGTVYLTMLQVRGTPYTARQPVTVSAADGASIHAYGRAHQTRTVAGVDNDELVQSYADYVVNRLKDPAYRYRRVTFEFPEDASHPLWRPAFNDDITAVKIWDTFAETTPNPRPQWIAGEAHVVDAQSRTWRTTWFLEDYTRNAFAVLDNPDLGVLDETAILAF